MSSRRRLRRSVGSELTLVWVQNEGTELIETNYFDTAYAERGLVYVSINQAAIRVLVPKSLAGNVLGELRGVKGCALSRDRNSGSWEVLFDDETNSPFSLHLSPIQVDRIPPEEDSGRMLTLSVWTDSGGKIRKVNQWSCQFRIVNQVPCLRPWNER